MKEGFPGRLHSIRKSKEVGSSRHGWNVFVME